MAARVKVYVPVDPSRDAEFARAFATQFRRQAAALIAQPPRRMSFKRTWTTFHIFLWSLQAKDASGWRAKYRQALRMVTQDKLPNRPGRSFEPEAYA